jgi:hypothetical protein
VKSLVVASGCGLRVQHGGAGLFRSVDRLDSISGRHVEVVVIKGGSVCVTALYQDPAD